MDFLIGHSVRLGDNGNKVDLVMKAAHELYINLLETKKRTYQNPIPSRND
jgi:hypothetical protein